MLFWTFIWFSKLYHPWRDYYSEQFSNRLQTGNLWSHLIKDEIPLLRPVDLLLHTIHNRKTFQRRKKISGCFITKFHLSAAIVNCLVVKPVLKVKTNVQTDMGVKKKQTHLILCLPGVSDSPSKLNHTHLTKHILYTCLTHTRTRLLHADTLTQKEEDRCNHILISSVFQKWYQSIYYQTRIWQ